MHDTPPSLGTPPRLLAGEMMLRAMMEVVERTIPGITHLVFDRAHERLNAIGPKTPHESEFFARAHQAIDTIMQVPTAEEISIRAGQPRENGSLPPSTAPSDGGTKSSTV